MELFMGTAQTIEVCEPKKGRIEPDETDEDRTRPQKTE